MIRSVRAAAIGIVAAALVAGPSSAAFAGGGSQTHITIALNPVDAQPLAGRPLEMSAWLVATDGTTPAGKVEIEIDGPTGPTATYYGTVDPSTHEALVDVGTYPISAIGMTGWEIPNDPNYVGEITATSVTIASEPITVTPVLPTSMSIGTPVKVTANISAQVALPPTGLVSFSVAGKAVGSCEPAKTSSLVTWSCGVTLPAPTNAGTYSVTATYAGSADYDKKTGTASATVPGAAVGTGSAAGSNTKSTPPAPANAITNPTSSNTATPVAAKRLVRSSAPVDSIGEWLVLALAVALLLGVGIVIVAVLRRRAV